MKYTLTFTMVIGNEFVLKNAGSVLFFDISLEINNY